eukprot:Blabericola_migrator_1__11579@NODE_693_length_6845_cov_22_269549_g503_i0_p2_GENE_NODE_693_length_6845_cov_22_269549_g503_i0NODE_693_length_6845_cov_22_269549_g503_i0_p2_ORF_typecomplete_len489_score85_82LAP1C/PF05609_12/0_0013Mucin15/PF15672_5/0_0075Coilin_N/PF15862_5/0_019AspBHydro_N/PF05279_11/0_037PRCC/PF10253_9/0_053SBE2/PF17076_5/0_045Red1/PF07964_11/0_1DUF966/PF06136_13/0_48Hamartin/PF04388_12/0_51PARM/PF17061_5/1_6RPC_C/PF11800_8/3_1DUF4643/PF15485_6/2_2Hid1/PF12722_7/2_2Tim54/PF11711_8/5
MKFSLIQRLTYFWILLLSAEYVTVARAASKSKAAVLYSFEETGSTSDDWTLFRSVFSELRRLLGVFGPKIQAAGLHSFKVKPKTIPSAPKSLATHLFEPDDPRQSWELMTQIPSGLGSEGIVIGATTDPDTLKKADITHREGSNGVSEILDKLLNYNWPTKASPYVHVIFTDCVPHFRGYNNTSPYDETDPLWDDLMSSSSGYPSVEEAKAKVESSPILNDYIVLVFTQVTSDRKDTRQAWKQGLHAMGLDGRFSVHYLPVEISNHVQADVLAAIKKAINTFESGNFQPYPTVPEWPGSANVTVTESSTEEPSTEESTEESTTEESTTEESTTEASTTEESTTEESTTEASTTEESTTEESTTEESTTEESTTEKLTTEGSTTESSTEEVTTTKILITSSTVASTTSTTLLGGVSHDVDHGDSGHANKIIFGAASAGVGVIIAAAAYHVWGSPRPQPLDTTFEEPAHAASDDQRRDTVVRVTDFAGIQ